MKNDKRILGATGTVVDQNSKDDWANYFSMYNTQKSNMTYEEAASTYGTNMNTFASAVPHVVASPGHDKVAQAQKMAYSQSRIVAEMEKYNKMWAQRMVDTVEEDTDDSDEFLMEVTDVDNIEMVDECEDASVEVPCEDESVGEHLDEPEDDFDIDPYDEPVKLNPKSGTGDEGVGNPEDGDEPEYKIVDVNGTLGIVFGLRDDIAFDYDDEQPVEIDMIVPESVPYIETKITVDINGSVNTDNMDGDVETAVVVDCEPSESVESKTEESVKAEENKATEAKEMTSETVKKSPVKKTSASAKKPAAKKAAPKKTATAKKASTGTTKKTTAATKKTSTVKTTKK